MENIKLLKGKELLDYFVNNGILAEANRTFFHPLGIQLIVNNSTENIDIFITNEDKGFLFEKLPTFQMDKFKKFSGEKYEKRSKLLGFGIQFKDLFRATDKIDKLPLLSPARKKLGLIIDALEVFTMSMYRTFLKGHENNRDDNLTDKQFDEEELIDKLVTNIDNKDWIDVANIACLLEHHEKLKSKMSGLRKYRNEYNSLKEEKKEN